MRIAVVIGLVLAALPVAAGSATAVAPGDGRITARPHATAAPNAPTGLRTLAGNATLYVPRSYTHTRPAGFVLSLHGAYQETSVGMALFRPYADKARLIVLAPNSSRFTWDGITGDFGPDIVKINRLLRTVFGRYAIDPKRVFIAGFSDGASYALGVGITNGDVFKKIVAFSPGSASPAELRGKPPIFVSHGTKDTILPIGATSRRLVPELRRRGYRVTYREFDGPHTVPPAVARAAVTWLR